MTSVEESQQSNKWLVIARVLIITLVLFVACNVIFALLNPMEALGRVSLYNAVLPGRERLPYGENSAQSYNLSTYNIPAMFASHVIVRPKADDEFRVIVIGDSGTWGWLLNNRDTLAGQINAQQLTTADGKRVVAYNLGYPVLDLTKDLMILEEALKYQPDLIVWPVTLESFPRAKQIFPSIVQNNATRVRSLIERYQLNLDLNDPRFVDPDFLGKTIVGQRRNLADWLRLQVLGFSWAATRIDQAIPDQIKLRQSDFEKDVSWQTFTQPVTLTENDLAFDVLGAGMKMAGDVPVLIINEPMFISSGQNSDLRYNSFYPRWAYDQFHEMLNDKAATNNWHYLDLWDSIAPDEFTDTPVHLTPNGMAQYAKTLGAEVVKLSSQGNTSIRKSHG
ncbi:MAG TPA: hypothetical protein VMP08_15525 [Anaerolineae bacterium]|nr:hypothetical protein [Anaerolineae bacterium]